jgi:DNA-directed RNA polymerase sigma subunit (sigma70/sigma32)
MMTREKWLEGHAIRRAKIIALRAQDKKLWTLRKLGKKFKLSPERIRQLLAKEHGTESNTDHKT